MMYSLLCVCIFTSSSYPSIPSAPSPPLMVAGTNIQTKVEVAIKLECVKTQHPQLHIEAKFYKMMQSGGEGTPVTPHVHVTHLSRPVLLLNLPEYQLVSNQVTRPHCNIWRLLALVASMVDQFERCLNPAGQVVDQVITHTWVQGSWNTCMYMYMYNIHVHLVFVLVRYVYMYGIPFEDVACKNCPAKHGMAYL